MRLTSVLCVLALAPWLAAADALGTWQVGDGTIDAKAATAGAEILPSQLVTAGEHIVRVSLAKAPKSQIMLSPHSTLRITEDGTSLVVQVESGVIQADIADKGPYKDMHFLGAAIDVRITGTLFVVERVKADTDYVALIQGKVQVNLRRDVAVALGGAVNNGVELDSRQGIGGSTTSGLAAIDALNSRPQLPSSSARAGSVQQDATDGSGGWGEDDAAGATAGDEAAEDVRTEVANQVTQEVSSEVSQQVTQEVVNQIVGGGTTPLGTPPPPPN